MIGPLVPERLSNRRRRRRVFHGLNRAIPIGFLPLLFGLSLLSKSMQAADSPSELARSLSHRLPVSWVGSTGDMPVPLVRLSIPPELFAVARPDLFDLRLLARVGPNRFREIPFLLRRPQDVIRIVERPVKLVNLNVRGDSTEFLLDASQEQATVNSLVVQVDDACRNYERPVRVSGADFADAAEWTRLSNTGYLLDVSRPGHRMTVSRIEFPTSNFRWYKISIPNDGQPPLKISGCRLFDRVEERAPRREFDARRISVDQDSQRKESRFVFDLGSHKLPLSSVRFDVNDDGNFYRTVNLQISEENGLNARWRLVAAAQLYSIVRSELSARDTGLSFSEASGRYLRLTVQNGEDAPLDIDSCHGDMIEPVLLIDNSQLTGQEEGTVHLYAGDARLEAPHYDLSRRIGAYNLHELPELSAGALDENPWFSPDATPRVPGNEQHKPLLWGVTLLSLGVLGGLTVLVLRKGSGKRA